MASMATFTTFAQFEQADLTKVYDAFHHLTKGRYFGKYASGAYESGTITLLRYEFSGAGVPTKLFDTDEHLHKFVMRVSNSLVYVARNSGNW